MYWKRVKWLQNTKMQCLQKNERTLKESFEWKGWTNLNENKRLKLVKDKRYIYNLRLKKNHWNSLLKFKRDFMKLTEDDSTSDINRSAFQMKGVNRARRRELNEPQNFKTAAAQWQTVALFGDVGYSSPQYKVAANFHRWTSSHSSYPDLVMSHCIFQNIVPRMCDREGGAWLVVGGGRLGYGCASRLALTNELSGQTSRRREWR